MPSESVVGLKASRLKLIHESDFGFGKNYEKFPIFHYKLRCSAKLLSSLVTRTYKDIFHGNCAKVSKVHDKIKVGKNS